ncbi:MAG: gluconate 2-dehydrogenase subunit 3 family protein [Gammaproteobacteria bacterium]|nr:gluconate 2-dehydrogenase subunit 3 family protein [Gammaproteobacteria bacterium]
MKSLDIWNRTYSRAFLDDLPHRWQRRAFLRATVKTATVIALAPLVSSLPGCSDQRSTSPPLSQAPWPTLAAVQEILLPHDAFGPGAADIRATPYLHALLQTSDFDPEERQFILDGAHRLDDICQEQHQRAFLMLDPALRDPLLRDLAESRVGDRWLGALLTYILEAMLGDPVYGGNPNGIGWRWLEHTPGFPRPSKGLFHA